MKKGKILYSSKPTIWYYLVAIFFPTMFFLVDDSSDIFKGWATDNFEWIAKLLAIFMFFGIPILLILIRREIQLYEDRLLIIKPVLKKTKVYYFTDLIYWKIRIIQTGGQTILILKFKNKKIDFNKIEISSFNKLQNILETKYIDKKL